jgi:hypothetical protein
MPFRKSFKVQRKSAGFYKDGEFFAGAISEFLIQATVQPLSGNDLIVAQEGNRSVRGIRIYTNSVLNVTDTNKEPDFIYFDCERYKITSVKKHQSMVISHYKYIAILMMDEDK